MASELPKPDWHHDGEPPWKGDPNIRKDRHVLVPDTVEWSGKKPRSDERRWGPATFMSPSGWDIRMPVFDRPRGRVIGTSSCTGLETSTMPFASHAWDWLAIAEAAAFEFLSGNRQISRVDFARDMRVPNAIPRLRAAIEAAVAFGLEVEIHLKSHQLGITFLGAAGGDRLRIYHKGLETQKKFGWKRMDARLVDVVRVELQCRKGQLDERLRKDIRSLQTARVERAPSETDIPVMKLKPSPGHGIKRRHLSGMSRDRHPQRAVEATEAVDHFLLEHGFGLLLPGEFGAEIPDALYGEAAQRWIDN